MIGFSEKERLLIFAPHPDDEILGCGGLMAKIKKNGGQVHVAAFSTPSDKGIREKEFLKAMNLMKTDSWKIFYPSDFHLRLDTVPMFDLIQNIEHYVKEIQPTIIAIPFPSFNQDHTVVYNACIAAMRSPAKEINRVLPSILIYEFLQIGWIPHTDLFVPNLYVDITAEIDNKVEAFKCYKSQNVNPQYAISSDSVQILAQMRGHEVSINAAEAYILKRACIV